MNCSICHEPIIESKLSVSGYVHKPNPLRPLLEDVMRVCYGRPNPDNKDLCEETLLDKIEALEEKLADAHSFIIRLSHLIRDYEERPQSADQQF